MISVAIDGTSGSGKSTVAKILAKKLGFVHLNTGELYRAVAYKAFITKVDYTKENEVNDLLKNTNISVRFDAEGEQITLLDGEAVGQYLHNATISNISAYVSQYLNVRQSVRGLQRQIANSYDIVMEGRDIGTEILPNATYKFFLTASPEVRAHRRFIQLQESGDNSITFDSVLADIKSRDERDMTRKLSPLKKADDAIMVDSSDMNLDEVVEYILEKIE